MIFAKVSTAISIIVGPILDSTGAEYASAVIGDLSISKNGGTLTALAATATLTYIANGQYTLALTTTNMNTLGVAQITCNKATYQMPPKDLMVVPSTVYAALFTNEVNATGGFTGATGTISTFSGAISTLTQTQVTGGAYALNSSSFAFNAALDFTTTQKAATIARVTLTDTVTTYTGNTPQTGDSYARIGATGSGLTSLAPSATALSTVTWTGALATNLATTNTTVAANLDAAVSSRSTLTQTQVTGGAYALNSASFAFNAALDFTTTQKAATLARVTLTDTATNLTNLTAAPTDWLTAAAVKADAVTKIQAGLSTLTQTQVTGGAYALNSALFAFNAALDFTTAQKAATLARVTLTDTVTTYTGNTPQTGDSFALIGATGSGLTSLAPASTALSSATWTNTLATNLGTTNTTVAANLDAAVSSRMATYTQPTGFLTATFPATVASTTNITAGTITTATNLTNLPSIPANWITAAGITAGALNGKGDWLLSSSYTAPLDAAGIRTAVGLGAANLDLQLNSIYTVAGLVQAKTDNLPLTPASSSDCITAAGVRAAIGMSSANLDTQLATLASYIDTEVGAIYTRIGAPTGVSVSADIAAVQADVDNIQTRIPTSLGTNGNIKADIQDVLGTASAGAAGYMGVDWSKITNQSSEVNLLQTTFLTTQATLQVNVIQWAGEPVLSQTDGVPIVSVIRYYDVGTDGYRYYPAGFANTPATPAAAGDCITAAGVRAAVGMAEADLDSQLDAIYTTQQTSLGNQTVMDTKLNNIKVDTAAILDDTGTTGVVIAGGSGAALVAATAAQITVDHGSGSYARNTEPPTAAQIWAYDSRTLTSGGGGGGATAAEVWGYTERTLTSGGGGGLTAEEVWAYADRTLTPAALDSIMAATGLESGRYLDTEGNPVTQINLRQAIALLLAYSLGDRSGIGTRAIISKLAGDAVQVEAERISQSVIEASGVVPV